jgi:lipid-A-disaccharide synthase
VLALAPSVDEAWVRSNIPLDAPLVVSRGNALEVLKFANVGLLKSGTSNLQAAFLGLPFVMYYQTSWLSAFIARKLVKLSEYSPVNIIRPGTIKELIQEEVCADRIFLELSNLLDSGEAQANIQRAFDEVRQALSSYEQIPLFEGSTGAYERTARLLSCIISDQNIAEHK